MRGVDTTRRTQLRAFAARCCVTSLLAGLGACDRRGTFVQLVDLDGARHAPQDVPEGRVHVIVFTSHECPISNAYAPVLRELAASWGTAAVRLFLVQVEPDLSVEGARAHAREYRLPGTILLDPARRLADALGATRTPEAVVLSSAGLVYRGRIDDQWSGLGTRSSAPSTHDLSDAVRVALAGGQVPAPHPPAVGCLLPARAR